MSGLSTGNNQLRREIKRILKPQSRPDPFKTVKKTYRLLFFFSMTTFIICFFHLQQWRATHIPRWVKRSECKHPPKLEPLHESIMHHLNNRTNNPNCENNSMKYFDATLGSEIVPLLNFEEFQNLGVDSCWYRIVTRFNSGPSCNQLNGSYKPDDNITLLHQTFPISLNSSTRVPEGHEFTAVFCMINKSEVLVDSFPFVHLKLEVEKRLNITPVLESEGMSVLILGIDALSRMNFIRTFEKSYQFLENELSALEMNWYNKVGDNTFPNAVPLLTGKSVESIIARCGSSQAYMDFCPMIWKDYSRKGYRTAFTEDAPRIAIFNFATSGFKRVPTDYYLRPWSVFADSKWGNLCHGPRLAFLHLMDYVKRFVNTMRSGGIERKFFHFLWTTSLTHDDILDGYWGDNHLLTTLQWLKADDGRLGNTILIVMSDHGNRYSTIENSLQGQLENRLPPLYIVLPPKFKTKYSNAYGNMVENQNWLITPYDVHETLKDILDIENLKNEKIRNRSLELYSKSKGSKFTKPGISLFLPIPSRTCAEAGIPPLYCTCNEFFPVGAESDFLKPAAKRIVETINFIVRNQDLCQKPMNVSRILWASKLITDTPSEKWEMYEVSVEVAPGLGNFQAVLETVNRRHGSLTGDMGDWAIVGDIERTNRYGNQSWCVDDPLQKLFCYCKESINLTSNSTNAF